MRGQSSLKNKNIKLIFNPEKRLHIKMGIPRFYKYITDNFDVSRHTSFKRGHEGTVDNLYLDANGILHNCAREIYFPKQLKRLAKPLPGTKKTLKKPQDKKVFKAITDYMVQLFDFVEPQHLFYIAIDGPAPIAKQTQQRQRRYKAAQEKSDDELATFDTTAITPGTKWMYDLSQYIHKFILDKKKSDSKWADCQIIFSGPDVPGEGEHKIVQYIRDLPNREALTHCMYGLDADLFMLGLSTHCPKFYLLREDQFNQVWDDTLFYQVDIGKLRREMFEMWGVGDNINSLIDDFIFCCFLIGNDFLHALPPCHKLEDSIDFIMGVRKQVLKDQYITNGLSYNINNLLLVLKELAGIERQTISSGYWHQNFPNPTLVSSLKNSRYPKNGIDLKKYRELYYRKAGIDHSNQTQVHKFCRDYLQGLEWTQRYYHAPALNWHWYFPYHYTPLVTDIIEYLTSTNSTVKLTRVAKKDHAPISAYEQLLCVVPPRSGKLLPQGLRKLYTGPLKKYYPTDFKLDLEGKHREWEAIAILPFIKLSDVQSEYQSATTDGIPIPERNQVGETRVYG